MSGSKKLSVEKTLVCDLKVQVVDRHLRLKALYTTHATPVLEHEDVHQADATVTNTKTQLMNNVQTMVAIESFEPVELSISNATGMVSKIDCQGLFVFFGHLDSVEIRGLSDDPTRVSYVWS